MKGEAAAPWLTVKNHVWSPEVPGLISDYPGGCHVLSKFMTHRIHGIV